MRFLVFEHHISGLGEYDFGLPNLDVPFSDVFFAIDVVFELNSFSGPPDVLMEMSYTPGSSTYHVRVETWDAMITDGYLFGRIFGLVPAAATEVPAPAPPEQATFGEVKAKFDERP